MPPRVVMRGRHNPVAEVRMHSGGLELTLVFLLAAVIAVPVFRRFGLGAVLGYLAAGVVLGPFGARVIRDVAPVLAASEIGVVMLLFVIGLELSPSRLQVMRKPVFGAGGLQMGVTGIVLALLAMVRDLEVGAAIVVGLGLAFSSTAVGLQLLAERKTLTSAHGRLAFAILLFQDLMAIPLLAAIPLIGGAKTGEGLTWIALLKAFGAIAGVIVGGRLLLRQLFRVVARTNMPEVFTASALLVVLGSAWIMQLAGLTMGLGAFLAGVLLADSEFRHELEAQIRPFEGLLLGLFFIAIGMTINVQAVIDAPGTVWIGVTLLMLAKFAILYGIGRWQGGLGNRDALLLGGSLALGGEFAFVVFGDAFNAGLIDGTLRAHLVAIVGVSMALTPPLYIGLSRWFARKPEVEDKPFDDITDESPEVLIAGFGRFGQVVARLLAAQRIPFIAIEHSQEQVEFMRRFGSKLYYGDPANVELLRSAGAASVRVFVIAIDDVEANLRTVRMIRRNYPEATVLARARNRRHAWQLMDLGAEVVRETFHSSLVMGKSVLIRLGLPPDVAAERARRFAEHDEALLRTQYLVYDDEDALIQTSQQARRELEQLFGADRGEGVLKGLGQPTTEAAPSKEAAMRGGDA
jgi:monovalent cation:proton antiporter-2 (CPA2) family protein